MGTTPYWFRCRVCRYADNPARDASPSKRGFADRIELTGETKPNRSHRRSPRTSGIARQYRCLDCGNVGWSTHVDLEGLEENCGLHA